MPLAARQSDGNTEQNEQNDIPSTGSRKPNAVVHGCQDAKALLEDADGMRVMGPWEQ